MALQFVFGGSGSGKSHYLYQRIIQEAGEHPALNYMVLVPEQFTMQTQKDLVLMNEKKGIYEYRCAEFRTTGIPDFWKRQGKEIRLCWTMRART